MKRKNIVILLLTLCIFLTGCSFRSDGSLILTTEAGFAPYEYYSGGSVVGIDIDIAQKIADRLNKKLIIRDVAFDSIISEVKTGKSDIGAAGISYTPEREKEVSFTINYASSKQIIVVKKDSDIKSPDDLKGKVAVQLGSVADTFLTEENYNVEIVREKKFLAAIQDLKDGKVNAVVMDELPATKLITDELIILEEPLLVDNYGMVVSKENTELLKVCNEVISEMLANGEIDEIILKHMGVEEEMEGNSLYAKFYNTLIYDNRYEFVFEGLKNTIIMALGAVIIGTILGSIFAIIRNYNKSTGKLRILNYIAKSYINIIRGTPSILQLMIIYYVIFKSANVNIVLVGILAFGINSSAYVAEIIRAGLASVDKGQIEAGYALGLKYSSVMRYIVFPQAIKNILPALGNEFITLVKETAVGAYIGIVELTKASDIIASRTYDYFFPLIMIAIIYLLITYILSRMVSYMERRLNNARN